MGLKCRRHLAIGGDPGHFRIEREGPAQRRMIAGAVIAFPVIFPHQLPVGLFDDGGSLGDLGIAEIMHRKIGLHDAGKGIEIRRGIGQADVDQASKVSEVDRFQPIFCRIEIGPHAVGPNQLAVEVAGPLVIAADQLGDLALLRLADLRPAVATGVVEGPDFTVATAHDDYIIGAFLVALLRYEAFEHFSFMIDRPPKIVPLTVDPHEDLVNVQPPVARPHPLGAPSSDPRGKLRPEPLHQNRTAS